MLLLPLSVIFVTERVRVIVLYCMNGRISCIIICLCLLFTVSCSRERDEGLYSRLFQWDALLQEQPEAIRDSLVTLRPGELSQANRAYYGLLKTIADDKTYVDFTSDSLINSVESYFHEQAFGSNHHIRALTYHRALCAYVWALPTAQHTNP